MKKIRSWSKPYLRNIIGRKKVDWSMFEHGSTIPKQFYEDFTEANQHQSVKVGESVPVKLIHNNRSYKASLRYVDRSRSNMEPVLQLRYDTNSVKLHIIPSKISLLCSNSPSTFTRLHRNNVLNFLHIIPGGVFL